MIPHSGYDELIYFIEPPELKTIRDRSLIDVSPLYLRAKARFVHLLLYCSSVLAS